MKTEIDISARRVRLTKVLDALGGRATWYRRSSAADARRGSASPKKAPARRGPRAREGTPWERSVVETVARAFPWYGYKKIALICRRLDEPVAVRKVYRIMKELGLLHRLKKRTEQRARQEVARLHQLLPTQPDALWQMDVTYIPVPGYGWWYAVTVIDYYSRYLLACHFTHSYAAVETGRALRLAVKEAERLHGSLSQPVFLVTDNGSSFIAHRFREELSRLRIAGTGLSAFSQVRIGYRMPTQLGLLERFHGTLKREEVYWNVYADPRDARQKLELFRERYNQARPHWALVAANSLAPRGAASEQGAAGEQSVAGEAPAKVLTPHEVYVDGNEVNPPQWSRWVGWLEKDQENEAQPPNRTSLKVSA